jgi:hypothetical protein
MLRFEECNREANRVFQRRAVIEMTKAQTFILKTYGAELRRLSGDEEWEARFAELFEPYAEEITRQLYDGERISFWRAGRVVEAAAASSMKQQ